MARIRKSAPILLDSDVTRLLDICTNTRYPARNRLIVLLTYDAGLKAGEIAGLTRRAAMTDGLVGFDLSVTKGQARRVVPMTPRLREAVIGTMSAVAGDPDSPLILSERCGDGTTPMRSDSISYRLYKLFEAAGMPGFSSHSGRAAFLQRAIRAARALPAASLRDVQQMAGFKTLSSLEPYAGSDSGRHVQRQLVMTMAGHGIEAAGPAPQPLPRRHPADL